MACPALSLLQAEEHGSERTTARLTRHAETLLLLSPWIPTDAHLRHRRAPPLETSSRSRLLALPWSRLRHRRAPPLRTSSRSRLPTLPWTGSAKPVPAKTPGSSRPSRWMIVRRNRRRAGARRAQHRRSLLLRPRWPSRLTRSRNRTPPVHIPMSTPPGSPAASQPSSPLFVARQPPLLPAPSSTPPRQPANRRKTLAGVAGFNTTRCSPRLRAKNRKIPVAQMAERLLCQRMGIIDEGQQLTEDAIGKFVDMFQGRLPDLAVSALRALFNLDCDLATAVEDAMLEHGGDAGPELQASAEEIAGVSA
ncbi:hypothetical protein ACQJBY_031935 [Aegilops geniculata]